MLDPRRAIPGVEIRFHDLTNGGLVIEFKFPPGVIGSELQNLTQREHGNILEGMVKACASGFRRVREARRGPASNPRDIIYGRPEDRTDPLSS